MTQTPLPSSVGPAQELLALVKNIACALADDSASVRVQSEMVDTELVIRLNVSTDDLGKLIGKQGRTARSLRAIVGAAANKHQIRCAVDIRSDE